MENEKVVVAIELGSSKISGAAASKGPDGRLEVLAYATLPSSSFIRNGAVYNLDRTAESLAQLIELLERQLGAKINKVFTGYAGKSMRTVPVTIERDLEEGEVITSDMVDGMLVECGEVPSDNMLSLCVASQEFMTDHKSVPEQDPIGVACTHVLGRFQRIMIRPRLFKLMDDSFSRASLEIADSFVAPHALAGMVLTEDEKQRGCVLIDYGSDNTTVLVYKSGQLCYLRVIPLGSDTITKDIMSQFQLTHEEADSLKCSYGLYGLTGSKEEIAIVDAKEIPLKLLGEIIEARNEEIMTNVVRQIRASGYYDSLFGGIVVTGGGSNLRKLRTAMAPLFSGIGSIRICNHLDNIIRWKDQEWDVSNGTNLSLIALLENGNENCCEVAIIDDPFENLAPANVNNFEQASLFNENGEDAQPERDRKRREKEEERRRQRAEKERMKEDKKTKTSSFINGIRNSFHKFFDDVQ